MDRILRPIKKLIPRKLFAEIQPAYHKAWALGSAARYGYPSRKIKVVGVTGTKGKSTTTELVNAVLEEAGYKTALSNTLRFKVGSDSRRNLYKMSMPGRGFMQKFLREAVDAGCEWAVIEMTSEGTRQFRHKGIELDCLIFTNLSPEHIESHGSYESYIDAKVSIGRELAETAKHGHKAGQVLIANAEDKESARFLALDIPRKEKFSIHDAQTYILQENGTTFQWGNTTISSPLPGAFNLYNMLAAATFAKAYGIKAETVKRALEKMSLVRGRVEKVTLPPENPLSKRQDFTAVVDYAHTADSLAQLYGAFAHSKKICILGNTGGGRDKWKRPEMAKVAEDNCDQIILTNEDPYDEDPRQIVEDMKKGMKDPARAEIIMDRREAINSALRRAQKGDVILISGKGTDPYIMGPNGSKMQWDDAAVVREELQKVLEKRK